MLAPNETIFLDDSKGYAAAYLKMMPIRTPDLQNFVEGLLKVIDLRIKIFNQIGFPDGSLIRSLNSDYFTLIYDFFNELAIRGVMGLSKPFEMRKSLELDLSTMILYFIILESEDNRDLLKCSNIENISKLLKFLYLDVNLICSYQTCLTTEEFIEENAPFLHLFISKIEPLNERP